MTTRTTSINREQQGGKGLRTVVGMAVVSAVVLAGAALGLARAGNDTAAPSAPAAVTTNITPAQTSNAGVAPRGGLAEQYQEIALDNLVRSAALDAMPCGTDSARREC